MTCEAETLILAVEKYPCVWNIHDTDYHNRDVKDLAWEKIFKEVLKDWDIYSKVEQEIKGADLKKKWTNIRDYFRKDLQKIQNAPTGSAAKKFKKYVYAELLYFLTPVFDKRHTEGNYETEFTENNNSQECEFETQGEQIEQVDDHTHTNIQPPSPVSTPPASNSKRKKKDIPTQILSILHQNQQKVIQQRQEVEDDDTKFLLSFRTHMKHKKENQKLEFKLGMLQLVQKINTDTEYCSSPLSSPLNYNNFSDHSVTSGSSSGYSPHFSYIPVPGSSPDMFYKIPSPVQTFSSSSLHKKTPNYQSTPPNSRVIINSIRHLPPLQPQPDVPRCAEHKKATFPHHYNTSPTTSLHVVNPQHDEDTEAATFLVTQGQYQNVENYLN